MTLLSWLRRVFGGRAKPQPAKPDTAVTPVALPRLGLNVHDLTTEVHAWLSDSKCPAVRMTYYVHKAQLDAAWRQGFLDDVRAVSTFGVRVCVVVHSLGPDEYGDTLPDVLERLLATAQEVGGRVAAIQIGNEINDTNVDRPNPHLRATSQFDRGHEYAELYQLCRLRIRLGFPKVKLVVAGIVGDPTEFLKGMQDVGVTPDVVACHVYGWPLSASAMQSAVTASRAVFPSTPVWLTEIGSEAGRALNEYGDANQESDMRTALETLATMPDVTAYWYVAAGDWENSVLRDDGSERPAGTRYRLTAKAQEGM